MFIDIHVHSFLFRGFPRTWSGVDFPTPEQLIKMYDELGIKKGVVLPLLSPEGRNRVQSSEEVIEVCKRFPDRLIPFCNVDPRMKEYSKDAGLGEMLLYYQDRGCKGLGEITSNLPFDDSMVQNLFKFCDMYEMPTTFHIATKLGKKTYGLYDDIGLPRLEKTLQRFPNILFLGHSQAFWAEIGPINEDERGSYPEGPIEESGRVIQLMEKYSNLHGDLSASSGFNAISRDKDFGLSFLEKFQDRLYFGTDITKNQQKVPLVKYLLDIREEGLIEERVFQKIAKENALRLLKIEKP